MEIKLNELKEDIDKEFSVLSIYGDSKRYYFIILEGEDTLCQVITHKDLTIETVIEYADNPLGVVTEYFFTRHDRASTGELLPKAIVRKGNQFYRIVFLPNGELELEEDPTATIPSMSINNPPILKDFDIKSYVERGNKVYICGVDKSNDEPMVGVIDILSNSIDKIYYLYSDKYLFSPKAIYVDDVESRIIVGGERITNNTSSVYVDMFLL